ncbi:beta-galactosidase [Microbacterium sp. A94]|uniref:beta-galactosidase n=1 Tax=Microbacterium sp. A94 TaxID=3450717 RepID=UPI003F42DBD6
MKILYGGDYNPEQWPRPVWEDDYAAFDLAGIDTVTIGVFAWSYLQPDESTYDFSRLDEIVARAVAGGRNIVLATATAALPPWLATQYPEVNRTDFEGRRHLYGQRHNACPNSPVYRRLSAELAGRIAERYAGTPALVAWHVGNEYGGYDGGCWCDNCAVAFRLWLRERYETLDRLNDAWNATFWSHLFTDWDQIVPPSKISEHWRGPDHTAFQGITLDYRRFISDSMRQNFRDEKARIREHDPDVPVTTNFMGAYRPLDYHSWADDLDFVSWDNYPPGSREHVRMAFAHDLMRGIKGGKPFWVMEQTPTITASRDVNPVKRPGVLRLWSWQAVAHGADAVLYFQMRQSKGACEKYHGAVLDHSGRTDTRAFTEAAVLGSEFEHVGDTITGAKTPAKIALLVDWNSWWAAEMTDGFNRHAKYIPTVLGYYRALWNAHVDVDVISAQADLSRYDVVIAPMLHMLTGDIVERLEAVAGRGGSVVASYWSGRVDVDDNAFLADAPGPLGALFGVRVDETDSAAPGEANPVTLGAGEVVSAAELVFELLTPLGAEVVGAYGADFYAGTPAVTRRDVPGGGQAWYVGTGLDDAGLAWIIDTILARHGLVGPYAGIADLEVSVRDNGDERTTFLLNHATTDVEVAAHIGGTDVLTGRNISAGEPLRLKPTDVLIIRSDR